MTRTKKNKKNETRNRRAKSKINYKKKFEKKAEDLEKKVNGINKKLNYLDFLEEKYKKLMIQGDIVNHQFEEIHNFNKTLSKIAGRSVEELEMREKKLNKNVHYTSKLYSLYNTPQKMKNNKKKYRKLSTPHHY